MNIIDYAKNRYAAKSFDSEKKIETEKIKKFEELLQLSPSSINLQPWHYVIAGTEDGKNLLAESAAGSFEYNKPKILDASHVVVFCSKTSLDDSYLDKLIEQEEKEGRFGDSKSKDAQYGVKIGFSNLHRNDLNDAEDWMKNQIYLSAGYFLLGVSALGLDACPMEGFDRKILDNVLGLKDRGYSSQLIIALGYSSRLDFNSALPKSRMPIDDVISRI